MAQLFFPDPWPKRRHMNRRLIQPSFLASLARCVQKGGILHIVTDNDNYATCIDKMIQNQAMWHLDKPEVVNAYRVSSAFERRGLRLEHRITEFVCRRA